MRNAPLLEKVFEGSEGKMLPSNRKAKALI
jgi:hypothetical protein